MQHVILFTPSRCCKGRMGEAVAATRQLQYVRHKEGAELVIDDGEASWKQKSKGVTHVAPVSSRAC